MDQKIESTVSSDVRWSVGMGREVRVLRWNDDRQTAEVVADEDAPSVRRAVSDLRLPCRPGQPVRVVSGPVTSLGVVTARSLRGIYVWVPGRHRADEGDLHLDWEQVPEVVTYDPESTDADAALVRDLYAAFRTEQENANTTVVRKAEEAQRAVAELAAFKVTVHEVATRYARDHEWCDTVSDALEEMGLERIKPEVKRFDVTVNIEVMVSLTMPANSEDYEVQRRAEYLLDEVPYSGEMPEEDVRVAVVSKEAGVVSEDEGY